MFDLITALIARTGLWGVFGLMLLENLVPIIPSELILPLAGYQAAQGRFYPVAAILLATAGSSIGGSAWYLLGRAYGLPRLRALAARDLRLLPVTGAEIDRATAWFARWGRASVCVGRAVPGVRGVICLPAGLARMPFPAFLLWSSIGAFAWSDLLISSGYALRAGYASVKDWIGPVSDLVFVAGLAAYAWKVVRGGRRP